MEEPRGANTMHVRAARVPRRAGFRALAVTVVVALGTTLLVSSAAAAPKEGGSITYGLESETGGGWCPTSERLAASGIMVEAAIYDLLVVPNAKNEMVPYLAKSVGPNADYTQWTIKLRDGIKFHDGTPLDADAVKQNIEAWRKGALYSSIYKDITDVTVNDPLTLTITVSRPWLAFASYLYLDGRSGIVAPAQLANPDTCNSNLIGTGPFKLDHWTVNQELVVTKNADYWQKDSKGKQLPYLDKITFKPIAEASQRVNSLVGKQLDVMHTSDGQQVDALNQMAGQLNLMKEKPGRRETRYYLMNVAKAPLDDIDARMAVALAIDRNQINQIRNNGVYDISNGPFDFKVPGYVKDPGFPKYNLKKAKALASKYKAAHAGEFSVVLEHTNDPANSAEAQLIKEQLAKAGIDATLKQDDQTAFVVAAISGNFSIMLWRQHPGNDPDGQYVWWNTGSLVNFGKIADPELQALIDQGRSETDPAKRKAIYQQVDKLFAKKVYNIWAYYADWTVAAQKNVQGLAGPPLPDGGGKPEFIYGRHPLLGIYKTQ
ncbi:MAG: ABC transporter substrate-binding protein [Acidimicrobiia bacterium]